MIQGADRARLLLEAVLALGIVHGIGAQDLQGDFAHGGRGFRKGRSGFARFEAWSSMLLQTGLRGWISDRRDRQAQEPFQQGGCGARDNIQNNGSDCFLVLPCFFRPGGHDFGDRLPAKGAVAGGGAGVAVVARAAEGSDLIQSSTTDAQGRYVLSNLAGGRMLASASRPGYFARSVAGGGRTLLLDLASPEELSAVDFEILLGGAVTGHVTDHRPQRKGRRYRCGLEALGHRWRGFRLATSGPKAGVDARRVSLVSARVPTLHAESVRPLPG